MISNYKIPGFLLVSLGGLFLSSGGALFKLFENQDVWTIYFWRSFFFTPAVLIFLFFTSKNQVIKDRLVHYFVLSIFIYLYILYTIYTFYIINSFIVSLV